MLMCMYHQMSQAKTAYEADPEKNPLLLRCVRPVNVCMYVHRSIRGRDCNHIYTITNALYIHIHE